jgi:hypothetical protein
MNAVLWSDDGAARIEFENGTLHADDYFTCTVRMVIDGEEWEPINLEMIEPYRADMLGFFEEIARGAARGWNGENRWVSEFSQLHLTALSSGTETVTMRVYARWKPDYETERRGVMEVSPQAVERLGERMRHFLRMETGHRFRGVRNGAA